MIWVPFRRMMKLLFARLQFMRRRLVEVSLLVATADGVRANPEDPLCHRFGVYSPKVRLLKLSAFVGPMEMTSIRVKDLRATRM
jgi:hypothetical protein